MEAKMRDIMLFLDKATCHPKIVQASPTSFKLVFMPRSTGSILQPLVPSIITDACSKPCQTSKMELFVFQSLTNFGKSSVLDVGLDSEYPSALQITENVSTESTKNCYC